MNRKQIEEAVHLFSYIKELKDKIGRTEKEIERIHIQGADVMDMEWYNSSSEGRIQVPGSFAQPLFEGVISLLRQEIENSYKMLKEMGVEGD